MSEEAKFFGHLSTGEAVYEYTLNSPAGVSVKALNYGGAITAIEVPTADGPKNIVLSFENLAAYESNPSYAGVLVGRYGGRLQTPIAIGNAKRHISATDRGNCLHGGDAGFHKKLWTAQVVREPDAETLHLKLISKAGEAGFPGNLTVHVSYKLLNSGQFQIIYRAISDEDTPVSLTQHSYFNLNAGTSDILNHRIRMDADGLQKTDEKQTPIFEWLDINQQGFTKPEGQRISDVHKWIKATLNDDKGLDYPFRQRLNGKHWLESDESRLRMVVTTSYDSVVVYAGGWLDAQQPFKQEGCRGPFGGICFEAQVMPNGPHHPSEPVGILPKGEVYHHWTTFTFETIK